MDDFCKSQVPPRQPGRPPALSDSAVITLLGFSQWRRFGSERDFYRYAETRLRDAFPRRPNRSQSNRHARRCYALPAAFWRYQSDLLEAPEGMYQALDSTAVPTRAAKRRGKGWRPGQSDIGYSNRLGWYAGFHRRRWVAGKRQIVETAFAQLQGFSRLGQDRPHTLEGLQTRLVPKVALHNFCIGLNRQLSRPNRSLADLLGW